MDIYVKSSEVKDDFLKLAAKHEHPKPWNWRELFSTAVIKGRLYGKTPVVLIDLGAFKSVKVPLTEEEFEQITRLGTAKVFTIDIDDLKGFISNPWVFDEKLASLGLLNP